MEKKKKSARYNAFTQYMRDRRPDLQQSGVAQSIIDCVVICRPEWMSMSKEEQKVYADRAKAFKEAEVTAGIDVRYSRGGGGGAVRGTRPDDMRLNNQGFVVSAAREAQEEESTRREREQEYALSRWPVSNVELMQQRFYLVHFQYCCELHNANQPREWLPVEVAIIEWSLASGISRRFHRFIDPGEVPLGYTASCIERTNNTHAIPHENFDLADNNYYRIWQDIRGLIKAVPPILYCKDEHKEIAQFCLHWLHLMSCSAEPNSLLVYNVEDCVQSLVGRCGKSISTGSVASALESSTYDYEDGTRCKYHFDNDNLHCSLTNVSRWAFGIALLLAKKEYFDFCLNSNFIPIIDADADKAKICAPLKPAADQMVPVPQQGRLCFVISLITVKSEYIYMTFHFIMIAKFS